EFILSTDADADRALLLGFELLLARVECYHFLDLMVEPQLGPQEWLDVLQRRKLVDPTEKQTIPEERQDNNEKNKLDKTEVGLKAEVGLRKYLSIWFVGF
ncbi:hypothetical protein XENORESO_015188, partial [Xenotaenia resolanae]